MLHRSTGNVDHGGNAAVGDRPAVLESNSGVIVCGREETDKNNFLKYQLWLRFHVYNNLKGKKLKE